MWTRYTQASTNIPTDEVPKINQAWRHLLGSRLLPKLTDGDARWKDVLKARFPWKSVSYWLLKTDMIKNIEKLFCALQKLKAATGISLFSVAWRGETILEWDGSALVRFPDPLADGGAFFKVRQGPCQPQRQLLLWTSPWLYLLWPSGPGETWPRERRPPTSVHITGLGISSCEKLAPLLSNQRSGL